jgi:hypothetical protein
LGQLLIEFDIDAEVEIIKSRKCDLQKNCEVEYEEYVKIKKTLGPGLSKNIAKFDEKVKDLNFDAEDIRLFLKSDRGEGCLYETITYVASLNNQEEVINL